MYRGDPSACKTLTAVVADLDGNVIGVVAQDNTGETLQIKRLRHTLFTL